MALDPAFSYATTGIAERSSGMQLQSKSIKIRSYVAYGMEVWSSDRAVRSNGMEYDLMA